VNRLELVLSGYQARYVDRGDSEGMTKMRIQLNKVVRRNKAALGRGDLDVDSEAEERKTGEAQEMYTTGDMVVHADSTRPRLELDERLASADRVEMTRGNCAETRDLMMSPFRSETGDGSGCERAVAQAIRSMICSVHALPQQCGYHLACLVAVVDRLCRLHPDS